MGRAIDDLTAIMEEQIQNYERLKGLTLEKRKAITSNDLKQLADLTLQIEGLIGSNSGLEEERIELVKKMAKDLGLSPPRPTLERIAMSFEGSDREKLLDLRSRATDIMREVQRQNRINTKMLKYSAQLIDSVLRCLVEDGSCKPTYSSTGEAGKRTASASLLDQQI